MASSHFAQNIFSPETRYGMYPQRVVSQTVHLTITQPPSGFTWVFSFLRLMIVHRIYLWSVCPLRPLPRSSTRFINLIRVIIQHETIGAIIDNPDTLLLARRTNASVLIHCFGTPFGSYGVIVPRPLLLFFMPPARSRPSPAPPHPSRPYQRWVGLGEC